MTFGAYHALVLGNDTYRHFPPLKTAVNDARAVAALLEEDYGFTMRLLLNTTRDDALTALSDMRGKLTDSDNLLIYYAGRGELDTRHHRGHWLPIDAEPDDTGRWISNVAISDLVNAMSVRQLLVVADTCYSGTLTRAAGAVLVRSDSEEERIKHVIGMSRRRSRMVMTSGGVEPVLDRLGGQHSVFAKVFLDALRGNVGVLPAQDLYRHLHMQIIADVQRATDLVAPSPEFASIKYGGHEAGDFIFVRAR